MTEIQNSKQYDIVTMLWRKSARRWFKSQSSLGKYSVQS